MEILKKILSFDIFPFICRLISVSLFAVAIYIIGFPPNESIGSTSITFLILSIFFLLLPIASKISLGKIITFERQVDQVKNEVKEFKTETREFLSVYSNMITAISNTMNQTINVNLPGQEEAQKAKEDLDSTIENQEETSSLEDEVYNYISQAGNDINFALAKLRMDLERTLRELVEKEQVTSDLENIKGKFMSARQLFREFTVQYPKYKDMHSSFDYILKICNAGIHGHNVSEKYAYEDIYMGLKMIKELNKIKEIYSGGNY
jgi:hypothetical protein